MTTLIRVQNKCVLSTQTQLLGLELDGTLDTAQRRDKRDFDSWICNIDIRIVYKEKTILWFMTWKPCARCALRWTVNFFVHSHPSLFERMEEGSLPGKLKTRAPDIGWKIYPYVTKLLRPWYQCHTVLTRSKQQSYQKGGSGKTCG